MIRAALRGFFFEFSADAKRFLTGATLLELGHAFVWVLQNLYVRSVGYGESDVGLVLSFGGLGVVLSTIPAATLYDRIGPRASLTVAAVGASLAIVGMACVTSLPWLFFFAMVQAASFTVHRVVAAPFIVTASRAAERTRLFGAEHATHTVASTFGLAVAGLAAGALQGDAIPETVALRVTLILGGLLSLGAVIPYHRLTEVDVSVTPRGNAGRSDAEIATRKARRRELSRRQGLRRTFRIFRPSRWHLWWRLALPHLMIGVGAGLTIPFINLYFTDRFDLAKSWLGLVMAGSQVTMTVAVLAIPRLVGRIGLLKATILTELLSLPFFLILAFTGNFALAVVAFVFRTAFMNLSHPIWRNLMMDVTPGRWRAAVNGVAMLAWNAGWAVSNRLGGELIEGSGGWLGPGRDGYVMPMLITTTVYLLAIVTEARFFWPVRQLGRRAP